MPNTIDDHLRALSHVDYDAPLEGLENAIWTRFERDKADAAAPSMGVQLGLAAAALAMGLMIGLGSSHTGKPAGPGSEMTVLSDDSGLAPSMRLGGV